MNYKDLSVNEKLTAIQENNFLRSEVPQVEEYILALVANNQAVIDDYEAFGNSPRHIIENRAAYMRGVSAYGFVDKAFDKHGWLVRPIFFDTETVHFDACGKVMWRNNITIGRGLNGKWTYCMSCATSTSGHSCSLSVHGIPHDSRRECLIRALTHFISWHEKENDRKSNAILKNAKDMLDEFTGRKPVQLSLLAV